MISSFLNVSSTAVVNRVRHAVDLIESVEWEDHNEQGFHLAYGYNVKTLWEIYELMYLIHI